MKIAIMQPYFLPYLGYFQLIHAADKFVVYDNIEYTKQSWFNRNRILLNGKDHLFTIPLTKSSDYLKVNEKFISDTFEADRKKILAQIQSAYRKAPYFKEVYPVIESIFKANKKNLFEYLYNSLLAVLSLLSIDTEIIISSDVTIDHELKGADKVIAICNTLQGATYYNPIGGVTLYNKELFKQHGIDLYFLEMIPEPYDQGTGSFISHLSIIDVLMFNGPEQTKRMLDQYKLI
jgi:hypothetical protein